MNRSKYLAKNTIIFAIGNLGSKLINFLLVPLFTNILTTQEYGTSDLIFTICSIASPLITLNINEAIMRFSVDDDADINSIMSIGVTVAVCSFILGIPLYLFAVFYLPISNYKIYVYIYAITYGIRIINVFYLRGKENLIAFSISSILSTLFIGIFSILFLAVFRMGVEGYLLAFITSNILTGIYAFVAGNVKDVIKNFIFDSVLFRRMIAYSLPLIPNSFMWWIIDSSDRIMITTMIGVSISGIYAVASKITGFISFLSTIFNQAYSYSAIHENNSDDKTEFNNKIMDMLFLMVTIVGITVLAFIKPFMEIYVGKDFLDAWKYAPPLIIGTCILVMATFFSVFYTVSKDSMGFLKSGSLGALVNIILNLCLIKGIGALGAAIATCLSYFAIFLFRYFDTKKYISLNVFNTKRFISFMALIVVGLATYNDSNVKYLAFITFLALTLGFYRDSLKLLVSKSLELIWHR